LRPLTSDGFDFLAASLKLRRLRPRPKGLADSGGLDRRDGRDAVKREGKNEDAGDHCGEFERAGVNDDEEVR
jgi:hypothetical protein